MTIPHLIDIDQKLVLRSVIEKWKDNHKGTKLMWNTRTAFNIQTVGVPDVVRIVGKKVTREWQHPKKVERIIQGVRKECWEYTPTTSAVDGHDMIWIAIIDE